MAFRATPTTSAADAVISPRTIVADHVWRKLRKANDEVIFVEAMRSCVRDDTPHKPGSVRAETSSGYIYEPNENGTGTKVTIITCTDPKGNLPTSLVNHALRGAMELRLKSIYSYFVERKNIDGTDNGGVWPDDEALYAFKVPGQEQQAAVAGAVPRMTTSHDHAATASLQEAADRPRVMTTKSNPSGVLRTVLGWFFLLFGIALLGYLKTVVQEAVRECEEEFGACVWGRMEHKL